MALSIRALAFAFCLYAASAPATSAERDSSAEATAQALYDFLLSRDGRIETDDAAQKRWLTASLRALILETNSRVRNARKSGKEEMGPHPHEPNNSTFFFAWDWPTACAATSSKPWKTRQLVFLTCGWGNRTNYPGMSADYTLVMESTGDQWRVDDIWFTSREENQRSTLRRELRDSMAKAAQFQKRGRW
jgi:hypothetical protein